MVVVAVIIVIVAVVLFYPMLGDVFEKDEILSDDVGVTSESVSIGDVTSVVVVTEGVVDWGKYNYDYVDENVKGILTSMVGGGRTAFYLPPVGYINVSKGSGFGVAFALNNPNPSGENMFEYEWTVDDSVVDSCGVSVGVGQGWIERGWRSWGKIPKGWVDHMTVYFAFPLDIEPCNVKYNFEIRKDGIVYDKKVIEFNLI